MDNTKDNQPAAAQDSDDLIAELARLVAQDARNTSSRSDVYKREEPRFGAEPAPVAPVQNDFFEAEDSFGAPGPQDFPAQPEVERNPGSEADSGPEFDFGSNSDSTAGIEESDPIADLIADAEVDAYDRDFAQETNWVDDDAPAFAPEDYRPAAAEPDHGRIDDFSMSVPRPAAPAAHEDERNPLHDIEALIGEAARANAADGGLSSRRVRSSYLDGTQTAAAADAAESAILAAAAATGTPVRRVEPDAGPAPEAFRQAEPEEVSPVQPHPDPLFAAAPAETAQTPAEDIEAYEDDDGDVAYERPRRRLNGFVLPVAAGAVIVALIGGIYFAFFAGPGDPGEAPVLTADAQPLKQEATPTRTETAASESIVFNEIEGNTAPPETEALVSRDQTDGANPVTAVLTPEEGATELVNRPVRTVTVRPDGTIVQAEDSVAGSNVLPVDRPEVPAVPNSTLTSDPIGEAIAQAMAGEAMTVAGETEQVASLDAAAGPVAETVAEDGGDAAPAVDDPTAPQPIPRPAGLTAAGAAPATSAAATTTTPVAVPTASSGETALATVTPSQTATAASEPGAWVQLASQRSEDVARAGMSELQARYGSLFSGAELEVSQVDLGERGIYYRVRLPQPSLADANAVCGAIQGQGGDCFVMDN